MSDRVTSTPREPASTTPPEGRGPEGPLENNADNSSPPLTWAFLASSGSQTLRDRRYDLRRLLWDVSTSHRLRGCGRGRRAPEVGVRYAPGSGAGFSGLVTCGSPWACPVCAAKIAARRSLELGAGLLAWETSGGRMVMITLTQHHDRRVRLVTELDAQQRAWASLTCSRVWKRWLGRLGGAGFVKVPEITWGARNGWHAHLHAVLLVAGDVAPDLVAEFGCWLVEKWRRLLERQGVTGTLALGQDVHLVDGVQAAADLGQYLAKSTPYGAAESMGRELFGAMTKTATGRHATEPAWRIAETFGETGDADLLDLWHEYERATKKRRGVAWSGGLRVLLGLGVEATDEEVADEVIGDADLLFITAEGWETAWRSPAPTSRILAAVETGGVAGLRAYLDAAGIAYRLEV